MMSKQLVSYVVRQVLWYDTLDEHREAEHRKAADQDKQIVIMLRTDVFRGVRARSINSTPWPAELYYVVTEETAKHLAEQPFKLPDLAAVAAEAASAPSAQ